MNMNIPSFPEPQDSKEMWRRMLQENRRLALANIKQGTWFTKPYWDSNRDVLKAQGITWQDLMEAYKLSQYKVIEWIEGKESWENVISFFKDQLNTIARIKRKV